MTTNNAINNKTGSLNVNGAYTLPTTDGSAGYVLATNGSGAVSWVPSVLQSITASSAAVFTITNTIPIDDTIPQSSEGTQVASVTITPKFASSLLFGSWNYSGSSQGGALTGVTAFFRDSNANAFYATVAGTSSGGQTGDSDDSGTFFLTSGTTSATTITMRVGVDAHTLHINADTSGTRIFGGVSTVNMTIQEIAV